MFNLDLQELIPRLIYIVPAIIIALTFHEYAHARIAYAFGDPTARNAGRLTLNPLKHLDPIGTILLLIANFGWAKPVPINPYYFQGNRKMKVLLVSLAGPLSNLLGAIVSVVAVSLIWHYVPGGTVSQYFFNFFYYLMTINVVLAIFNLIPVPPLDGSKILAGLLPDRFGRYIDFLDRFGFIILLVLVFFGLIGKIISPAVNFIVDLLLKITFMS
jgi:Zn-dependent protease